MRLQERITQSAVVFFTIIDCKYVLGCGSNVVDQLFRVQALPKPGEKGFFRRFVSLYISL